MLIVLLDNLPLATSCGALCVDGSECPTGQCLYRRLLDSDLSAGQCAADCDPFAAGSCPGGLACAVVSKVLADGMMTPVWVGLCATQGSSPRFATCGGTEECAPGLICEAGVCQEVCDLTMDRCTPPSSCTALSGGALIAGRFVGTCL